MLLSDGAANTGISPVTVAVQARREHIPIYTVALGTPGGVINEGLFFGLQPVPPDPQLMAQIARASGGRSFDAQTTDHLNSIYQALGRKLSTVARSRDVTVYALIVGGAAAAGRARRVGAHHRAPALSAALTGPRFEQDGWSSRCQRASRHVAWRHVKQQRQREARHAAIPGEAHVPGGTAHPDQ